MIEPEQTEKSAYKPKMGTARGNRVYHKIFDDLQQRIRQGDWLPGERMPSIAQLAAEYKVGAGSIREALRSLQSIGLVDRKSTRLNSSHIQKSRMPSSA